MNNLKRRVEKLEKEFPPDDGKFLILEDLDLMLTGLTTEYREAFIKRLREIKQ